MKIIIAPDSFKESLSSLEVARQIQAGFKEVFPDAEVLKLPVADGGEGTVEALVAATDGEIRKVSVSGPLGAPVEAFYGVCGDGRTAVIEMAAASGLALLPPDRRNPLLTSSFGTGQLIRQVLDDGLRHLIIGIGGSATNDAGAGMLQALGVRLLDGQGKDLPAGGGALGRLKKIDISGLDSCIRDCKIEVACDVDNPLTGQRGASAVFGPQKGATPAMVAVLDANLANFARRVELDLGRSIEAVPGAGAAGGMGGALLAFLEARLRPGVEIVLDAIDLKNLLRGADLVITGEGRIDGQSVYGKTPVGVGRIARQQGVPVIALAGSLGPGAEDVLDCGIQALFSVVGGPCSLEEALATAAQNVRRSARHLAAVLRLGSRVKK
ncbi:MAG: glycerate kinase [Desulfosarcinaceae bacterium]